MFSNCRLTLGLSFVLVCAVVALYGPFSWNPIIFDDLPFFMLDAQGQMPISAYHLNLLELRSLPYASLAWTKEWLGLELINFRIGNLLLHATVAVTLFLFLEALLLAVLKGTAEKSYSVKYAAFGAALFYGLHPVAVYAVGYLIQRTIIMATLFGLLALYFYLRGSVMRKRAWLWASVLGYYLAVFSKEHAIMLPAVMLAITILLHEDWKARIREKWTIFAAMTAIAVFVVLTKKGVLGSVYEVNAPEMLEDIGGGQPYLLSVLTQTWLFFKYVGLWIIPNPEWMSVDMREPFAQSLLSSYLLAAAGFIAWGFVAGRLLLKRGEPGLIGFAMLFPWLLFFTEFATVRIQESFVLYRSYFWMAGTFCMVPLVIGRLRARAVYVLLAAIVPALFMISMERLSTFSHPVLVWDDAEKLVEGRDDLPGGYRIYYNRGTELYKIGQYDRAIEDLSRAIDLRTEFAAAYANRGAAYFKKGEWDKAIAGFNRAIEIYDKEGLPLQARYFQGRAMALEAKGDLEKALVDYKLSCQLARRGCEKLNDDEDKSGTTSGAMNHSVPLIPSNRFLSSTSGRNSPPPVWPSQAAR